MGATSFVQDAFIGGEISQAAQGRITSPLYRVSMNVCLNTIPTETGATQRRPGTLHAGYTRGGAPGKLIEFDFNEDFPYTMVFTDGFLRFFSAGEPITTNDSAAVAAISAANPAVVQTGVVNAWASGNTALFNIDAPLLQNRDFLITVSDATHFSIADAITGAAIDGATLAGFTSGTVSRIMELVTPYTAGSWANLRSVQAETTAVLLNGTQPQILEVATPPTAQANATFTLTPSDFLDGPYLKPIPGSYITSSAVSGVVTLTLSFQEYDAAIAYDIGDYVTKSSLGYRSLTAANQGHTPASSPTNWLAVNAGDPINNGSGFIAADIGRLVRLFSEPELWDVGTSYTTDDIVSYADADGTVGYWQATGSISAGVLPGTSTLWAVVSGASIARWTWGRILTISGAGLAEIDSEIGNLTGGGGLAAAFDDAPSKAFASSANVSASTATLAAWVPGIIYPLFTPLQNANGIYQLVTYTIDGVPLSLTVPPSAYSGTYWQYLGPLSNIAFDEYVGGHFASASQIASATVYPPTDTGFMNTPQNAFILNLRGKSTLPSSPSDGTLLGTTGSIANTFSPVSIVSSDQTTAWNYVWIEAVAAYNQPLPDDGSHSFTAKLGIAQVQFFAPDVANGSVITAQIVGDPLLYSNACRTWRLGVYGGTAGWPTNGTYHEGRLWLTGVVDNRVDSSKSNDIFNFAPTLPSGVVADNNAISAVFDGPDVNSIFFMIPDQQGIICGTQAGEWLVSPSAPGAMSPTNIAARRATKIGCANIEPRRTDHTLVFVQKHQREIMEYFADVYSGKFSAPSLSERAKHLTVSNLVEIAYQQELVSVVWARRGDGQFIGTTYKRDSLTTSQGPNMAGAHRHVLGSGRTVESICVGASDGGNLETLSMITTDASGLRHVEVLTNILDEGFLLQNCWYVDDGIAPASYSVSVTPTVDAPYGGVTINGLWPHNGKTVSAFLIGLDCGDFVVTNGSIFVPFGDGNGNAMNKSLGGGYLTAALVQTYIAQGLALPGAIGFTFTSQGQIVRPASPADTGARLGPGWAKLRRIQKYAVQVYGAVANTIKFGVKFDKLVPARFKSGSTALTVQQQFTGVYRDELNTGDEDFDQALCWQIDRPYPANITALGGFLHTEDI